MGVVYLGTSNSQYAALKVVRDELVDAAFRQRFRREVEVARRVRGVCVAEVVGFDLDADPPWLATEFVDGPSLAEHIELNGPIQGPALLALGVGLAEALDAIHAAGVVHRDLTPRNVLLAGEGPKIVDFGIASLLEGTALTKSGLAIGTPGWMSPEQIRGERATFATDVFAWGGLLVYAATGRPPFGDGRAEGVMYRIMNSEPDLRSVPEWLRETAKRSLSKTVELRPAPRDLARTLAPTQSATTVADLATTTLRESWTVEIGTHTSDIAPRRVRTPKLWWSAVILLTLGFSAGVVQFLRVTSNGNANSQKPAATTAVAAARVSPTSVAPAATAPAPTAPPKVDVASLRYDSRQDKCAPDRSSDIDSEVWQTSVAPEDSQGDALVYPADRMELGLRDKFGYPRELGLGIKVSIRNPQERVDVLHTHLQDDRWATVSYPADEYDMWSGAFTVIWEAIDGRFIACSGFVVEELLGE